MRVIHRHTEHAANAIGRGLHEITRVSVSLDNHDAPLADAPHEPPTRAGIERHAFRVQHRIRHREPNATPGHGCRRGGVSLGRGVERRCTGEGAKHRIAGDRVAESKIGQPLEPSRRIRRVVRHRRERERVLEVNSLRWPCVRRAFHLEPRRGNVILPIGGHGAAVRRPGHRRGVGLRREHRTVYRATLRL